MDITTRHRRALDDWSYVQHLSQCVPLAHRPIVGPVATFLARIPLLGSAIRSLQRIRYLGALSQRQLILNQVCFEQAQFYEHYMASTNEVLATLQRQMAEVLTRQSALDERLLGLHESLLQSEARHNTLEAHLSVATSRMEADLSRVTDELLNEAQHTTGEAGAAMAELAALDDRIRKQSSQMRLLRHQLQISSAHDVASGNGNLHSAGYLPALIGLLESDMPELRASGDVGVSIFGNAAEDAMFALFTYFGDRLATTVEGIVASQIYYHIDFSPSWSCHEVFEGAARRLAPDGYFVIVTNTADQSSPQPDGFSPLADRLLSVGPVTSRVIILQNHDSLSHAGSEETLDRASV